MVKLPIVSAIAIICLSCSAEVLLANNVRIENLKANSGGLEATLSWDHGWNLSTGTANHDAVWLFAKIRHAGGLWEPVTFSSDPFAHWSEDTTQVLLDPAPDGAGLMARNHRDGDGSVTAKIHLQFLYPLSPGLYEFQLFGIEMVWVETGPFWIGDGASNFALHDSTNGEPYFLADESEVVAGTLGANGAKAPEKTLPAGFPKGYTGFYLMKHELSQAQYADFLNSLPLWQQRARTVHAPESAAGTPALSGATTNRNAIVVAKSAEGDTPAQYACDLDGTHPDGDEDGQNRACNWLSWPDLAAYLDWAALRPITELEYEKACRGPLAPVAGEFAWGTPAAIDANTVLADGSMNESVAETATDSAGLGSHGYDGPTGPLRCGFGAHATSDRLQAGAGYYGNLELSGNLWELCVTVLGQDLAFDGRCGDGRLGSGGDADVPNWPASTGVGFRGGAWNSGILPGFRDLAVSDRFYVDWQPDTRRNTTGGRGGR